MKSWFGEIENYLFCSWGSFCSLPEIGIVRSGVQGLA